jgi:hypothetical protein
MKHSLCDDDENGHSGALMKPSVCQSRSSQDHKSNMVESQFSAGPLSKDRSSDETYIVLKSETQDGKRDILFRFGSWCYAGKVKLVPKITASDVPLVMLAIRLQQDNLEFLSHVDSLCSPFAAALGYTTKIRNVMESQAAGSENYLKILMDNGQKWLAEDECESFFEFGCFDDGDSALHNVEMIATKANRSGLVTVSIFFGRNWYLYLTLGENINYPSVSRMFASGYNIQFFPEGISEWPQLRTFNLWRRHGESISSEEIDTVHNSAEPVIADVARGMKGKLLQNGDDAAVCVAADNVVPHVCNSHDDGDISISEQDQLDISHLEDSLHKIGSEDSQDDYSDEREWSTEEKPATCLNPVTIVPQACFDTDTSDIFTVFEKFDQRLDQELKELKEWEV